MQRIISEIIVAAHTLNYPAVGLYKIYKKSPHIRKDLVKHNRRLQTHILHIRISEMYLIISYPHFVG